MKLKKLHDKLVIPTKNGKSYQILKDFSGTPIEEQMKKEEKLSNPMFRVFIPVKPSSNRKLNIDPTHAFDPHSDSLMDYPSIISHKLNKIPWEQFNRLITFHIPLCPNDCWHCYLPKMLYVDRPGSETRFKAVTATYIIDQFLKQRDADYRIQKHSNVLRITGGEPFLIPELIFECLKILEEKKLDMEVFIWTETNLEPFIGKKGEAFMDMDNNPQILKQLGKFKNIAVHPCFHGLNKDEFDLITGKNYQISLDDQIDALKRLVDAEIDVYPTFGSNICDPANLSDLFYKLKELHPNLPFKIALVKYDLSYEQVKEKLNMNGEDRVPKLYSHFSTFRIWNRLLIDNYGIGYGIIPRHIPSIKKCFAYPISSISDDNHESIIKSDEKEIIYLFKGSYRSHYHQEVLECLALPPGHIFKIDYDKKYLHSDVCIHMAKFPKQYSNRKSIWFYIINKQSSDFSHFPFREAKILEIKDAADLISIKFELGKYIYWKDITPAEITNFLTKYFGEKESPLGGKYLLLGESFFKEDENNTAIKIEFSDFFPNFTGKLDIIDNVEVFQHIVKTLTKAPAMKKSLFYKINPGLIGENVEVERENDANRTIYKIKGGKDFKITMDYFLPNYEEFDEKNVEERTIYFETSKAIVTPLGQSKIVLSKYGSVEILFRTVIVDEDEEVTLTFFSKREDSFQAAKVELHILILNSKVEKAVKSVVGLILLFISSASISFALQATSKDKNIWDSIWEGLKKLFSAHPIGTAIFFIILMLIFYMYFFFFPKNSHTEMIR